MLEPTNRSQRKSDVSARPRAGVAWFASLVAGSILAVLVAACGAHRDNTLDEARHNGVIRIGYAVEAPFAYVQGDSVTGESPEIARLACRRLGIARIEWVQMSFDALIPALEAGRCDVIAAGMFITPQRSRQIAFSLPSFQVRPALLMSKDNPRHLTPDTPLAARTDLRIAVLSGSVEEAWFKEHDYSGPRLVEVPDAATGSAAVESNLADALALSSLSISRLSDMAPSGRTKALLLDPASGMPTGLGAFGFRKDETALREAWNAFLKDFIGSPEHRRLVARFGFDAEEIPPARPRAGEPHS